MIYSRFTILHQLPNYTVLYSHGNSSGSTTANVDCNTGCSVRGNGKASSLIQRGVRVVFTITQNRSFTPTRFPSAPSKECSALPKVLSTFSACDKDQFHHHVWRNRSTHPHTSEDPGVSCVALFCEWHCREWLEGSHIGEVQ